MEDGDPFLTRVEAVQAFAYGALSVPTNGKGIGKTGGRAAGGDGSGREELGLSEQLPSLINTSAKGGHTHS